MIAKNFNTPGLKGYLEGEPITTPYIGGVGGVKTEEVSPLWELGSKGIDFKDKGNSIPPLITRVKWEIDKKEDAEPTFTIGGDDTREGMGLLGSTSSGVIDGFIRGGIATATTRRLTDTARITKFLLTPNGLQFIAKEVIMQALNPGAPKIYNAGVNTLAQVALSGLSNLKRGGKFPNPAWESEDKGINFSKNKRESKYEQGNPGRQFSKNTPYNQNIIGTVDGLNKIGVIQGALGGEDKSIPEDFIKFRFEIIDHNNPLKSNIIAFRAFLDDIGDDYSAGYNEVKYSGRPEKFYTYNSFDRKIKLGFKIAAQTREEMKPLYQKLNYLVAQTAPGYVANRIKTPFMKLTVGDWFNRLPGIINSVNLSWNKEYSWEIKSDENLDRDMLELPHILDVSLSFTPIHNFTPSNDLSSPFISINNWL